MAFNLQVWSAFSTRIDGEEVKGGDAHEPFSYSLTGDVHRRTATIANGANAVVYANNLGSWNFLYVSSDFNTRLLLTDTNNNTFSINLRGTGVAESYGIPFPLAFDETDAGTAILNTIQAFNTSGNTARVTCVVIK